MTGELDIQFSESSLLILNIVIATMMFGVSLTLRVEDFKRVLQKPVAPAIGMFAQFLVLPALTCLGTWLFNVPPEFALGMMLVASCPGGAFSNVMTWLARGNVAVSVSMTAISSLAATVMTPFNFALYANLNPHTRPLFQEISLSAVELLGLILVVLALPIVLGMVIGKRYPMLAAKSEKPLRVISLLVFFAFVGIAFGNNVKLFLEHFDSFFWLVLIHNTGALMVGYMLARLTRLNQTDTRAVTLEVGIQNSGIALVVLFNFMPHAGGMMLIAAFWGVWHLVSGLTLSNYWARRPITDGSEATFVHESASAAS